MANPTKHHGGPPDQHGDHGRHDRGEHQHAGDNPQVSYERKDINIVQITGFGIGLLVAFMLTVVAMWAMFAFLAKREDAAHSHTDKVVIGGLVVRIKAKIALMLEQLVSRLECYQTFGKF